MFTTNYDVYLQKQVKQQTNKMLIINNGENKKLLQLKRDNLQKLMTYQHDKDVAEIDLIQMEIQCETDMILKEINAMKEKSVAVIQAENKLQLAKSRAQANATKVLAEAEAYKQKQHQYADNQAAIMRSNA